MMGDGAARLLAELRLPHPERARVVREVAADVVEMAGVLEARGMAPEEALRRAEETLLPAGPALEALERVHRPLYDHLTRRFPASRMRRWERTALVLLAVSGLVAALAGMARGNLLQAPSPFLLPVLALGVASVAAALAKAFQLFVKRDHATTRLRSGMGLVVGLIASTGLMAAGGFLLDLWALTGAMEGGPGEPGALLLAFLGSASALLASSLVLVLLSGLLWFLLLQWIAGVEQTERELGLHTGPVTPLGTTPLATENRPCST